MLLVLCKHIRFFCPYRTKIIDLQPGPGVNLAAAITFGDMDTKIIHVIRHGESVANALMNDFARELGYEWYDAHYDEYVQR